MRKIKRSHKGLMIIEAGFIYCLRHNLDNDTFIEDVLLSGDVNDEEFENLCKDLRWYRHNKSYQLVEMTELEYEKCVDKFGE